MGTYIVNMAILKEKLSYYLNLVKSGEEVVVTSHRHPVARILPVTAALTEIVQPTRPVKDLRKIKGIKSRRSVSGVKSLLDERRRR
jgi:prevent-host-death family protein